MCCERMVNELLTKLIIRHVRRSRRCNLPGPFLRPSAHQHGVRKTSLIISCPEIDVDTEVEPRITTAIPCYQHVPLMPLNHDG